MSWCPKCNEARESGIRFCPLCGVELDMDSSSLKSGDQCAPGAAAGKFDGTPLVAASDLVFTCPQCGRKFSGGTKFCPEDGTEVLSERALAEAMQNSGALPLSPAGLVQKKFSLLPDEKIILESRIAYYYEYSLSFKAGSTRLTQFRFVFCNNHSFLLPILLASAGGAFTTFLGYGSALGFFLLYFVVYGILIARKPTKITFQIPISQIKSITEKRFGLGSKYIFVTDAGFEYVIQFFYKLYAWESALRSLGINIQLLTKKGKPVKQDLGEAAAPATAGPTVNGTTATSPVGMGAGDLAGKRDWTPVLVLIAVMVIALGAGVYFWRTYQPAPPKPQEVKKPVEKPLAKTEIPKPESKLVKPKDPEELGGKLSSTDYFNKGRKAKNLQLKIHYYTKAIELYPKYVHAYNNRCIAHYLNKDYANALKDCTKAIEISPRYPVCYNTRGIIYYAEKEYEKALSDYNMAILLKKDYYSAYYNRGMVYVSLKNYGAALNDFSKVISLKPNYAKAYYERAKVYNLMGDNEQVLNDFNKARSLNPKLPDLNIKSPN